MKKVSYLLVVCLSAMFIVGSFAVGADAAGFTYTVQPGDTLYKIAQKYGTTAAAIKEANGLQNSTIYPNQKLYISSSRTTHTVSKGDTLYLIAKRYGVTVESLKQANNLWSDNLYPGQILVIPSKTQAAPSVSRAWTSLSREDILLMARVIHAEGRGEPYVGQVAIGAVILNRLKDPRFPKTIAGIVYQPWAFTVVNDGQINLPPNETAIKAAQDALSGWDPTYGALYYYNPAKTTNKWIWSRPITTQIGNHIFAK